MRVEIVRAGARHCGFGRIHVKPVNRDGAKYLAKYLSKQGRPAYFEGKRLWARFGPFDHCKVRDVEVDSTFTRALKVCQEELQTRKVPFVLVRALQAFPTENPAALKLACSIVRKSGNAACLPDLIKVLALAG